MGIINLTPDSFYKESRAIHDKLLLNKVEKMLSEGADIIDIGGFSSRPYSDLISENDERERIIPSLKTIVKHFPSCILSIDTYRSAIAREVINEGASIINDISGGDLDPLMYSTINELNVPYILMHMQGVPKNMQDKPKYDNVFTDIYHSFSKKLVQLKQSGVKDVILDVGFGFGKTLKHNYELLKKLNYFHSLQCPILVGISRKGMLQKIIDQSADNALNATTVAHTIALVNGANILRVHDIKEAKEAIQIVDFYQKL